MGASRLKEKNYSELVINQVFGKYKAREPQLIRYLQKVYNVSSYYSSFEIEHAPYEKIFRVGLIYKVEGIQLKCPP